MLQRVISTIEKYRMINVEDGIVVGVSGGPDSLVLLHVLNRLKDKYSLKLFAAHVNHNLRGQESDGDQAFVEDLCKAWHIPLFIESADIQKVADERKVTLEEAGREVRYNFFNRVCVETGAKKIAVAHNSNDNAETILMRIIRGSGLEGLSGIKPVRDNIIRPLIETSREDIEKYCEENGLNPRIDSSNLKTVYTRNKVRLELIPYLKKEFNENIIDTLNRMGRLLNDDAAFIQRHIDNIFNEVIIEKFEEYIIINLEKLMKQDKVTISRILRTSIEKVKGNLTGIEAVNIEDAMNFIASAKSGSTYDLPKGIKLRKDYNELTVSKNTRKTETKKYNYYIEIPGTIIINETNSTLESFIVSGNDKIKCDKYTQAFDYDKLAEGISLRNRQDGDVFNPKGMKGTKKLKDFFIDEKVLKEKRDKVPLIAKGNEIVWVIGMRPSEKYKVDDNTKEVLILRYIPNF